MVRTMDIKMPHLNALQLLPPPLQVTLTKGSPRVIGNSVEVELVTSRPVAGARRLGYQSHRDYIQRL